MKIQKTCEIIEGSNYVAIKYPDGRSEITIEITVDNMSFPNIRGYLYQSSGYIIGAFPSGLFIDTPISQQVIGNSLLNTVFSML